MEWKYKFHRPHPSSLSLACQTSPQQPSYFYWIHLNFIHLPMPTPSEWSLSLRFSQHTPVFLFSPMHATCLTHPIFLDLIFVMFNNEYKSWRSSLFSFIQPPLSSSILSPWILLSTLFSNTHHLCSSLNVTDRVSYPYKTTGKTTETNIGNCN